MKKFNNSDVGILVIRLAVGLTILVHGSQKALGLFGGQGFSATMSVFESKMGIPAIFAFLAIVAEFFGSLGVVFGFLTRLSALGVSIVMLVAMKISLPNGFFMNWYGAQKGEGIEYFIPVLGVLLALMITGGGELSLDSLLKPILSKKKA